MIIDTSAVVAMLRGEAESEMFANAIFDALGTCSMSAATYVECGIVIDSLGDPALSLRLDAILEKGEIEVVPVSKRQAEIARAAFRDFGKGSGHKAQLNFGDCFSLALAIEAGDQLLYKGEDFVHTGVQSVF